MVRSLRRLPEIAPESADHGEFFEHFIVLEVRGWIDYRRPRTSLHYWRSASGFEVDLVIDGSLALGIKATVRPNAQLSSAAESDDRLLSVTRSASLGSASPRLLQLLAGQRPCRVYRKGFVILTFLTV